MSNTELPEFISPESPGERNFLYCVRGYKHIGYGRMRQIISNEWHDTIIGQGLPGSGARGIEIEVKKIDSLRDEWKHFE